VARLSRLVALTAKIVHVGQIVADNVTISAISEGVRGYALDSNNAEALWKKSEAMVGENF